MLISLKQFKVNNSKNESKHVSLFYRIEIIKKIITLFVYLN